MNTSAFLSRLQGVSARGSSKWAACCPSHQDRNPSLAVSEGERGILIRCWAGCSLPEICSAVGLEVKDLFYDSGQPAPSRPTVATKKRTDLRQVAFQLELHALSLEERAKLTLEAAKGLDCEAWSDSDLDAALGAVGKAYQDLERAQVLFDVSDGLRLQAWKAGAQ